MNHPSEADKLRTVIPAEQIQKRVKEMARQISDDYRGQTIHALALLENGFIFMATWSSLEVPVICQFIKPKYRKQTESGGEILEIFLQPRTGYSRPACAAGRRIGPFRSHQRIPDE